jgi:porin
MSIRTNGAGVAALLSLWSVLALAQATVSSSAEQTPAELDTLNAQSPEQSSRGTEPQELLRWMGEKGLTSQISLINDWSKNFRGGACSAGSVDRYLFKPSLTLDTGKFAGWKGGTVFASLYHRWGGNGSDYTGDAQGFSNIDATPGTGLYEAWYEQKLWGERLRVKVGRVDATTGFAFVENASDFLSSSMGYSPTIMTFPTYPEPRPGVNVFLRPADDYSLGVGVFDTAHSGALSIVEAGRRWKSGSSELPGRFSAGFWRQNGPVACLDGDSVGATQGFYFVLEQSLWGRSKLAEGSDQTLSAFLQYGHAHGDVSPFTHHLGGGLVLTRPLARRSHDSAGLGATWVRFSEEPAAGFQRSGEFALESYYKIHLTRFLSLVPDLQFIHNPGGLSCQQDSVVLTPRLNVSF